MAYPQTLATMLAAIKDVDTVIPGHSPMMKPADVQEYQRFMTDLVAETKTAMAAGKTVDEAAAASHVTEK